MQPVPCGSTSCWCSSQTTRAFLGINPLASVFLRPISSSLKRRAALPAAQRARTTWKFTFLLPPHDSSQPMTNQYKEIKTIFSYLAGFRIKAGAIHTPELFCKIQLQEPTGSLPEIASQLGFFPSLVFVSSLFYCVCVECLCQFVLCLIVCLFFGRGEKQHFLNKSLDQKSLPQNLLPTCGKALTSQPHMGKIPVGH